VTTRSPAAMAERASGPARRRPVDWRRYSAQVRRARQRLPRTEHPLAVRAVISVVFAVAGMVVLQLVGAGVGVRVADLGRSVLSGLPQPKEADLVLGEAQVNVSAGPVLDPLPEFTKTPQIVLGGKVPEFALRPGRGIAVAVNAVNVASVQLAPDGRFGPSTLTLADGVNTVKVSVIDGLSEVASTTATVTVDREPPALQIVHPKTGDAVDGPDVTIEGTTEAGASVILNDHVLRPNPDGSFTDRLAAVPAGPLTITIVATDKAGNETKAQLQIVVKPSPSPAAVGTTLALTLDRTTVRPGETVVAQIVATEAGKPKGDLAVTLQVGVITIGTYRTDASGIARVGFAAPDHEVAAASVVVLGGNASATATLTVAIPKP
jgi:glucodextranase-like protein